MVDWENTFKEIEDAKPEIAVLPVGALEQHSTFMPVGTDFLITTHIARRVADALDAYLLPTIPFGNSQEHQDFFGTIWLQPATLAQVIKDICHALRHHGIRRILIINGHGGNWILKPTVREINLGDSEMMVILNGAGTLSGMLKGSKIELHSGDIETSRMMEVFPHLVKAEQRRDFQPDVGREYLDYVGLRAVCPTGVWGTPSRANRKKGKKAIDDMVRYLVAYARDTFARLEEIQSKRRRK
jgi:creatinine amidohydrolase